MNGLYSVFRVRPQDVALERQRAGRVLVKGGRPEVLEDYHGAALRDLTTDHRLFPAKMRALAGSAYHQVVPWDDHLGDDSLADLPEPLLSPLQVLQSGPQRSPLVFHYHREGMDRPHLLEAQGDDLVLDGQRLSPEESVRVLQNVREGRATLRYGQAGGLTKGERRQADPRVPVLDKDPMVPRLGNLRALRERTRRPGEVVVALDLNDFSRVNREVGWREGDEAIRAYGELVAKHGGAGSVRDGGDGFAVFCESPDEARLFVRRVREDAAQLPVVGGKVPLTAAFGIAGELMAAKVAVEGAKAGKYRQDGQLQDFVRDAISAP